MDGQVIEANSSMQEQLKPIDIIKTVLTVINI